LRNESLISSLSRLPNLGVIACNTVFRYKGKTVDPQLVGRELHVQALLMGSVNQRGETLRVVAELVDAELR
jgi:adenylate cyclase